MRIVYGNLLVLVIGTKLLPLVRPSPSIQTSRWPLSVIPRFSSPSLLPVLGSLLLLAFPLSLSPSLYLLLSLSLFFPFLPLQSLLFLLHFGQDSPLLLFQRLPLSLNFSQLLLLFVPTGFIMAGDPYFIFIFVHIYLVRFVYIEIIEVCLLFCCFLILLGLPEGIAHSRLALAGPSLF